MAHCDCHDWTADIRAFIRRINKQKYIYKISEVNIVELHIIKFKK